MDESEVDEREDDAVEEEEFLFLKNLWKNVTAKCGPADLERGLRDKKIFNLKLC